jgi:cytochrome c biogenesis protein CcmG/thiol:disulfide interchange protein DsbE
VIRLKRNSRSLATLVIAGVIISLIAALSAPATGGDTLLGRTIRIGKAHPLSKPITTITSWSTVSRGKQRILLNFWASWCIPCRDEIPLLYKYASATTRVATVVGVLYKDSVGPAVEAALKLGAPWTTLIDADGSIAGQVPVNAAPLTLLINANGVVLDYRVGPFTSLEEITAFATGP